MLKLTLKQLLHVSVQSVLTDYFNNHNFSKLK